MHDFRELRAWKRGRRLVLTVYSLTSQLPLTERFGLQSQMRRAAVSIVANIAEGAGRRSDADFRRFVDMACGSAFELEAHTLVATDLGFLGAEHRQQIMEELEPLQRMLRGLAGHLGGSPRGDVR